MPLTLAEQLLLIATDDRKGSVLFDASAALPYGLAGAVLLDLLLAGKLTWMEGTLHVQDAGATVDAVHDEALTLIAASRKPRDAKYWVSQLSSKLKRLRPRVYEGLVEKGILARMDKHFLWCIPYQRFPEHDPQPERLVRERLYEFLHGRVEADERLHGLLGLVVASGLLNEIVPKGERREAKRIAKSVLQQERVAGAVKAVAEEVQAAVLVAVVAATAASSASSS